jgi:hypothetical protein
MLPCGYPPTDAVANRRAPPSLVTTAGTCSWLICPPTLTFGPGGHQVVDLERTDPVDVRLHDHGPQGTIDPPARLERG